jgi:hypothetical protein
MTDKHPKRPRDPNQPAKSIVNIATGEKPDRDPTPEEAGKDPAAVAMGKKGGKARADSLSSEKSGLRSPGRPLASVGRNNIIA